MGWDYATGLDADDGREKPQLDRWRSVAEVCSIRFMAANVRDWKAVAVIDFCTNPTVRNTSLSTAKNYLRILIMGRIYIYLPDTSLSLNQRPVLRNKQAILVYMCQFSIFSINGTSIVVC